MLKWLGSATTGGPVKIVIPKTLRIECDDYEKPPDVEPGPLEQRKLDQLAVNLVSDFLPGGQTGVKGRRFYRGPMIDRAAAPVHSLY